MKNINTYITIGSILFTGIASYFGTRYSLENEINLLKRDNDSLVKRLDIIESAKPEILAVKINNIEVAVKEIHEFNKETNKLLNEILRATDF